MTKERVVLDNNLLVSGLLLPASIPGRAFHRVLKIGEILVSEATLNELADVLSRSKFDRYISIKERQEFLRQLTRVTNIVPITYTVRACRDPKDDMWLEVAVNGEEQVDADGRSRSIVVEPVSRDSDRHSRKVHQEIN